MGKYERKMPQKPVELIAYVISELHLDTLPFSSKVNLVIDLILLILCVAFLTPTVIALLTNGAIAIGNIIIRVTSDKPILEYIQVAQISDFIVCIVSLIVGTLLCFVVVGILDGFKLKKN